MGRMQREKGKRFERDIATVLRERWPDALVRRASQAERADNPDVFAEGGPRVLERLWLELQDARKPRPLDKLVQAEEDAARWYEKRTRDEGLQLGARRYPVVVWHRLAERGIQVTTRLWVLAELALEARGDRFVRGSGGSEAVTLTLQDFLGLL
jgi:hypothetical protein